MDVSSAINVCKHAEFTRSGAPGGADWTLFSARDSEKLRDYLISHPPEELDERSVGPDAPSDSESDYGSDGSTDTFGSSLSLLEGDQSLEHQSEDEDPIHAGDRWLSDAVCQDLYHEKGVSAYRCMQREGEAVVIPAGCAHQVSPFVTLSNRPSNYFPVGFKHL